MDNTPPSPNTNNISPSSNQENNINLNTENINEILDNFNLKDNNLSNMLNNLSKGDIGDMVKQFSHIISNNSNNPSACASSSSSTTHFTPNLDECVDIEESDDCNFDIDEENDTDFELDLNKYFISKEGKNICDVLTEIKTELVNINSNLNK